MGATEQGMIRGFADWPKVTGLTYQMLLDSMEAIGSKYETKEAQMSDVERVRIEFNYDPDHYGVNHPVGRAIQDLYTAVQEATGSVRAANWAEILVEEDEEDA